MFDNIETAVTAVHDYLRGHNFKQRDADPADFQYGDDTSLRFKVGSVYGEVSVQIVRSGHANPNETIRILNEGQIAEAKHAIDRVIAKHTGSGYEAASTGNPDHPFHCLCASGPHGGITDPACR